MAQIRRLGLKKPVIDFLTRWMSMFNMLTRLVEPGSFAEDFLSEEERMRWTESMCSQVETLTASLQPAQVPTKTLQSEQLMTGDFYGAWLTCAMGTSRIYFASTLATPTSCH